MISKLTPLLVFIGLLVAPYSASATNLFACPKLDDLKAAAQAAYNTDDMSVAKFMLDSQRCLTVPMDEAKLAADAGRAKRVGMIKTKTATLVIWAWTEGNQTIYFVEKVNDA